MCTSTLHYGVLDLVNLCVSWFNLQSQPSQAASLNYAEMWEDYQTAEGIGCITTLLLGHTHYFNYFNSAQHT